MSKRKFKPTINTMCIHLLDDKYTCAIRAHIDELQSQGGSALQRVHMNILQEQTLKMP